MIEENTCQHCGKYCLPHFIPSYGPYKGKALCRDCESSLHNSKAYRLRQMIDYTIDRIEWFFVILLNPIYRYLKKKE